MNICTLIISFVQTYIGFTLILPLLFNSLNCRSTSIWARYVLTISKLLHSFLLEKMMDFPRFFKYPSRAGSSILHVNSNSDALCIFSIDMTMIERNFLVLRMSRSILTTKFDSIKGSLNPKEIFVYFANVLYATNLWDKKKILRQVVIYFPGIKELL